MITKKIDDLSKVLNREYSHLLNERKKFEVSLDPDNNKLGVIRKHEKIAGDRHLVADIDLNSNTILVYHKHYFDILKDFGEKHIGVDNLQKCWEDID